MLHFGIDGIACRGGSPNDPDTAFWFSYDYGRVHYTSMSTEHPYEPGTPQYEWLEQDLAAANANRDNVPWVFLLVCDSFVLDDYELMCDFL